MFTTTQSLFQIISEFKLVQFSSFRIKFAPLNVPTERRYQTLAALAWILFPTVIGPFATILLFTLMLTTWWGLCFGLAYLLWIYVDRETMEKGGRRSEWFRSLAWWTHYRNYFPISLVKTADLSPDRNYLFGAFPHGILSSGAFSCLSTNASIFKELFPKMTCYLCVLNIMFYLPILREFSLAVGLTSVSKKSLKWILNSPGTGRIATVVVGGAEEAKFNKPGTYKVVLNNRKGFCKIALESGSHLVPVFSFGETNVYDVHEAKKDSILDIFQKYVKKITGVALIVFNGRGIFNYSYGIIPRRSPITVVVGKPIEVEKTVNPTSEQIDELHQKFKSELTALFNEEKHKYLVNPPEDLIIY